MTTYFDSLIDEAMHIADEVRVVADGLLTKILSLIQAQAPVKPHINGEPSKFGSFLYKSVNGISFNTIWEFYNFSTEEKRNFSKIDSTCRFYPESGTIYIVIIGINNKIEKLEIAEDIQHEVSHMFEFYRKDKIGKRFATSAKYKTAVERLNNTKDGSIENDIALIIYIGEKSEQRAFANGAYHYLMRSGDYIHNFSNAIKKTQLYGYAKDIERAYSRLSKYKNDENLISDYLSIYGISIRKLLKYAAIIRRRLAWYIGRIQVKAANDYKRKHAVMVNIPSSGKRVPVMETRIRKRISILEKYYKGTPLWHGFCKR